MNQIIAQDRSQIEFVNLESLIDLENSVRVVDAFVDKLDLSALGFRVKQTKPEGRPSFEPKVFLKLYFYGYLNGIRSSRKLERECLRNIEVQWLIGKLKPNYHSIADFRKDNPTALRNTFKLFVLFLKNADLLSGINIAIDGSKFRASNSKKKNFNSKKIKRHLKYIEEKTEEYLQDLDRLDYAEAEPEKVKDVKSKLERLAQNKINYELIQKQLDESGEPQISSTDTDARTLLVQGQLVEVSYNMQAAVDEKHKLIVAEHVINRNDRNALHDIAMEAKNNLHVDEITVLVDKGYHNGHELQKCKDDGIITICAIPEIVNSNPKGTTPEYLVTQFVYNHQNDTYICPKGKTLKTIGAWYHKHYTERTQGYKIKKYRTQECKNCTVKQFCTSNKKGGREIVRSEYADAVEENAARYKVNKELYRKRQEWNEHIFGTIKRKWGYIFTDLRGLPKVNGEIALIMTVYNFRRCINILGVPNFLQKIKNWTPNYKGIVYLFEKWTIFNAIRTLLFEKWITIFPKIAVLIRAKIAPERAIFC